MTINFSLVFIFLNIVKIKSNTIDNPLDRIKIFIQKYIPVSLLNLYRTYTYNLSVGTKKQPLSVVQKLITTTQKLLNNRRKILFYPDFPYRRATIYQICLFLGYDITTNPQEKFALVIKWQRYKTFFPNDKVLSSFSEQNISAINLNCQDVSKSLINRVFQEAFGYSIAVDPLTYTGKCVVKSNLNAQHDGKIISCPIDKTKSGVVYQKLIDNELEDSRVLDYRVPIFKRTIPFVYIYVKKNQTETQRFYGYYSLISVRVAETNEVFDKDEISKILCFCQKLGLDYGELDVLRNKTDKRLYIVDAKNTPSPSILFEPLRLPPEKCFLSPKNRQIALEKMAEAFQKEFFKQLSVSSEQLSVSSEQ